MTKRSTAISRYKAAARKIKRDRAKGLRSVEHRNCRCVLVPARQLTALRSVNEWFVWEWFDVKPTVPAKQIAGPFDTRSEAQEWIDEQ